MRGMTAAIIGGAVVLVVIIALLAGGGSPGPKPVPLPPVKPEARQPEPRVAKPAPPRPAQRSDRVQDRLSKLRDSYQHRQVGGIHPEAKERELPQATPPAPLMPQTGGELDPDDAAEIADLRHTLMSDPDPDERIGAVLLLSGNEDAESMRALLDGMNDPDSEVRLAVVEALGDYSDTLNPDVLAPALDDSDPEVRFEAVSILGDIETPAALAYVRGATKDSDEDVASLAEGILEFEQED